GRSLVAWAVRFVLLAWTLALAHYAFALTTGSLRPIVTPIAIALLAALGAWVRRWSQPTLPAAACPAPDTRHPALLLAAAFGFLFYHLLRRVAPRLAPWGVLWLFVTDHVMKGAVSFYAGVPVMIAATVAIVLAVDDGALAPRRLAIIGAVIAGAAVALIRRDGLPEFAVAGAVVMMRTRAWREPRLWAAAAGAAVGYLSWTLRPAVLHAPPPFAPTR